MRGSIGLKYLSHPLIWPKSVEHRLYQTTIADAAFKQNTLVIIPTALGKTVISAIVSAQVLYNYRDAKVLVLAPTRPLVMQHRSSFLRLLKLREQDTALLTGTTPPESRRPIWEGSARVFFSTPQVVRNDLQEKRLDLLRYGLLVFDECHRAVKRYAYTDIAKLYISQAKYPLILGMTASPGSQLEQILAVCRNLFIEHVEYRREDDEDVAPYLQPIRVEWARVDLPEAYLAIRSQIRSMLNRRLHVLFGMGVLKCNPEYATKKRLIEVGDELRLMLEERGEEERPRIFRAIMNQSLALTLFHMVELLETQGLWTLRAFLDRVAVERREKRSYAILVGDAEYQRLRSCIDDSSTEHPKLVLLRKIVGEQLRKKPASRMLVFTQYRDTASHLVEELNQVDGVEAERFVGQASRLTDKGLSQSAQAERIRMLEEGEVNVLVATSIAEEGLDIPSVDHVIFYEPIPSEIRYIQRRGRTGRRSPGRVTILAVNDSLDMVYLYASSRRTARMRSVAANVNSKLQTIIRTRPRPPPNPLTPSELRTIEAEAQPVKSEPDTIKTESEALGEFNRRVEKIAHTLYLKLLKRGTAGVAVEQLTSEMELEDIALPTLKGAIGKLVKQGLVTELTPGKYAVTSSLQAVGKTYVITVEKILPGSAVVQVDEKWRARLIPADYNGPKNLLKKNAKFRASAQLYRVEGTLCVTVKDVVETL